MQFNCPYHPKYKAKFKHRIDCVYCKMMWDFRCLILTHRKMKKLRDNA